MHFQGIYGLTVLAGLLLMLCGGVTDRLIPLFAVGAFLAFTLSQAGMVAHWSTATRRAGHSSSGGASTAWRMPLGTRHNASYLISLKLILREA